MDPQAVAGAGRISGPGIRFELPEPAGRFASGLRQLRV